MKAAIIGIITGIANGLFGAGGGTILVPAMQKYMQVDTHKSHATAIAVILPLTVVSALLYVQLGNLDWKAVLWVSAGGVAGGYWGAKLLNKFSQNMLHKLFGLCMIAAAVRLIFS